MGGPGKDLGSTPPLRSGSGVGCGTAFVSSESGQYGERTACAPREAPKQKFNTVGLRVVLNADRDGRVDPFPGLLHSVPACVAYAAVDARFAVVWAHGALTGEIQIFQRDFERDRGLPRKLGPCRTWFPTLAAW